MQILKNLIYLTGAEVFTKVLTFAAISYLARIAGPEYFGYVELAGSILLCASLIIDQGFGPYGAREIAKSPSVTAEITKEIITARLGLSLISFIAVTLFVWVVNYPPVVRQIVILLSLSLFISPFLLQWVFQGHSQMQTVSVLNIIRQLVYTVVVFLFIRDRSQIIYVVIAEISAVFMTSAYGMLRFRKQFGKINLLPVQISRRLFQEGIPIGLSQLFWMVRMFGATVIVGIFATGAIVGFFSSSMRILIALHAFIFLYYFNLLPSLARTWKQETQEFHRLINRSMLIVSWVGAIGCAAWIMLAPLMIRVVYGEAFLPATVTLQVLAGVWMVAALSGHYRFGLIATGYQNIEMYIAILGAAVAVVLLPLGYFLYGLNGAAMGLLIAEVTVWLAAWDRARKILIINGHFRLLFKPFIATALIAGLLWLAPLSGVIMRLFIFLIVIIPVALILEPELLSTFRSLLAAWWERWRIPTKKKTENTV